MSLETRKTIGINKYTWNKTKCDTGDQQEEISDLIKREEKR